jgi:hypothetical protein
VRKIGFRAAGNAGLQTHAAEFATCRTRARVSLS